MPPTPRPQVKAEDILAALGIRLDYNVQLKWAKQIDDAYKASAPEDTKLLLLGAISAVFPVFVVGKTGAANAPESIKGTGVFVSTQEAPSGITGWHWLVVESDSVELSDEATGKVLWTGKGEQYGLEGRWHVFYH